MRLFIRIFTRKESIEINPDDFDTIQDVILVSYRGAIHDSVTIGLRLG